MPLMTFGALLIIWFLWRFRPALPLGGAIARLIGQSAGACRSTAIAAVVAVDGCGGGVVFLPPLFRACASCRAANNRAHRHDDDDDFSRGRFWTTTIFSFPPRRRFFFSPHPQGPMSYRLA
jgi:hypothetical protein